ncbi:MAG: GTP pyrophosphokinase [Gemmatimonadales bacterium]
MSTLERAIGLAAEAPAGQRGEDGDPYILHPLRVMLRMDDPVDRVVAVLHDVLEKTPTTQADLTRAGFSDDVLRAVALLTREGNDEDYFEHVVGTAGNRHAHAVKIGDLRDNLASMLALPEARRDEERTGGYRKALALLGVDDCP